MNIKENDFVIQIATTNGSGSQSANNLIVKSIFNMGVPVAGKNIFPSNIAGLPTWFNIRVNQKGYLSRSSQIDLAVIMNQDTIIQDIESLNHTGYLIINSDLTYDKALLPPAKQVLEVSFKSLLKPLTKSGQLKKLLANMIYVGIVAEVFEMDKNILFSNLEEMFKSKPDGVALNKEAILAGIQLTADANIKAQWPFRLKAMPKQNKILIDGNTASALGLIYGGCSFVSWYPITPSSSITETFIHYAKKLRQDSQGQATYAVVQSEDELSAISMAIGAGWAGCRSITCTSGPGLSLMAEAAGLSYFAEVPTVIWDVQRGGPSTGLPTRTQQSDISAAAHLSHGDTQHILLLPADPAECFYFGKIALDLAEQLQTLIIVLTDLDLGMNPWVCDPFTSSNNRPLQRGKVLSKQQVDQLDYFHRYEDKDGDGIPYRTLPGTDHPRAGYFTRGTNHKEDAGYSESPIVYKNLLDRLKRKFETSKKYLPAPVIEWEDQACVGLIYFGSSASIKNELIEKMNEKVSTLRLRAYPFTEEIENFCRSHDELFVIEQNRDGQMLSLLIKEYPQFHSKFVGIQNYDGMPLEAQAIYQSICDQRSTHL